MSRSKNFTAKQRAFCREYLADFNATRAAMRAGYSKRSAHWIGSELLEKTHIREWVEQRQARAAARSDVTLDRVVAELAKIGFANIEDFIRIVDGKIVLHPDTVDRDHLAAVREIEIEPDGTVALKLHDKERALIALGQHLGGFKNRTELTTPPGQPLEVSDVSMIESARWIAFALSRAKKKLEAEQPQELEAAE